ncbi:MAG: MBL fold metallo-hydrolase [Actinobacteria bacterium]|nr:MBL fold metallo-hydrolase [Actinomycetota bacterium]
MSRLEQVAPGLKRWSTWHPEWRQEVGAVAVDTPDGLVLIDPLDPPPEVRNPEHVLVTVWWHARSAGELGAPHVWAPTRDVRRLKNRGVVVTDAFEKDPELPGGIKAFATAREGEVVYYLPQQKALVVGDVLLGAGAKPNASSDPLRLAPDAWLEGATTKQLVKSLLPLLDVPLERILVSHGDPVLSGGKDVLQALIAPEKA